MQADLVLAIDLGTSAVKVAAVTADGTVVRGERLPLGRQHPMAWWTAIGRAARQVISDPALRSRIAGIGLSGRGGATVLLDRACRAVGAPGTGMALPGDPRVAALDGRFRRLRPLASHVLEATATRPTAARRPVHALAAKDFVCLLLTDQVVTDPASGPDATAWPLDELAEAGFPLQVLPAVRLPWQVAGYLSGEAARTLGLSLGLPVAVGAHDGVAAQIGTGMIAPGDAALTLGTHAVLRVVVGDVPEAAARFRFYSLWGERDQRTVAGGNARMGGASVAWFARLIAGRGSSEQLLQRLEREAAAVPPGSEGVVFLPFLGGMYYPEQRFAARGGFVGLRAVHGRGHLYRALLEGVAFALRHVGKSLTEAAVQAERVHLTGGGSRSVLWRQILADVLGCPLALSAAPGFEECVGAARCAWVALGRFPDLDAAVAEGAPPAGTAVPSAEHAGAYARAYARYRAAVDAVWEWQEGR